MQLRKLAVGGAALLVGAFTVGAASPAYAQEGADLAVDFVGTTISSGVDGKFGSLRLTNNGPDDATDVVFTYDTSALDPAKVEFDLGCEPGSNPDEQVCFGAELLESGATLDLPVALTVVSGAASGSAGFITVTVSHAGTDPDATNNIDDAEVVISEERGVDLQVFAPDIGDEILLNEDDLTFETVGDLLPGTETFAFVLVENQGSVATSGLEMSLTLPDHVTFVNDGGAECDHDPGDSATTCQVEAFNLQPNTDDEFCAADNTDGSCAGFAFTVKVSEDATSGSTLSGGVAEAWDMELEFAPFTAQESPSTMDPGMMPDLEFPDIDPSDNVSFFAFLLDEVDDNGGGGGDVGDGDDEPLPVTGSPVVLISGLGAALLAVGAALYLVARRRRVIPEASDS